MEVLRSSREMTKREVYMFSKTDGTQQFKNAIGAEIEVKDFLYYRDTDTKGIEKEILTIESTDGTLYGGNSPTFARKFLEAYDMLDGEIGTIRIESGVSKAGKEFVTCRVL